MKSQDKRAVALQYSSADDSTTIVARGSGALAEFIIRCAENQGIPVKEDSSLLDILEKIEGGEKINEEGFLIVSELLSFLYQLDQSYKMNLIKLKNEI